MEREGRHLERKGKHEGGNKEAQTVRKQSDVSSTHILKQKFFLTNQTGRATVLLIMDLMDFTHGDF